MLYQYRRRHTIVSICWHQLLPCVQPVDGDPSRPARSSSQSPNSQLPTGQVGALRAANPQAGSSPRTGRRPRTHGAATPRDGGGDQPVAHSRAGRWTRTSPARTRRRPCRVRARLTALLPPCPAPSPACRTDARTATFDRAGAHHGHGDLDARPPALRMWAACSRGRRSVRAGAGAGARASWIGRRPVCRRLRCALCRGRAGTGTGAWQ